MKLLLVDSSAWIAFFTRPSRKIAEKVEQAKKKKLLAACGMICLEVIRGARNEKEFQELSGEFQAMRWLKIEDAHWRLAAHLGFQLSQKGLHPPATDLLIASVSMLEGCTLLHQDRHFVQIAEYFPLRTA